MTDLRELGLAPVDVVGLKRHGGEMDGPTIQAWIDAYLLGQVSDAQMAAWAMAVVWRGMTMSETVALCRAMAQSGEWLEWNGVKRPVVDKHSTGGVGDKLSLVVAPLAASVGMAVPMLSGRGLGHTGGTLDKLEAIAGYRVDLSPGELRAVLAECGCFIAAAGRELAPADAQLYRLRDQTGTVASVPLITASILAKKIAGGAQRLVLDVKYGRGAFMNDLEAGERLAESLVEVGTGAGLKVRAHVSSMDVPIGRTVGNALEVQEALEVLEGRGPADVRRASLDLVESMVELCEISMERAELERLLDDGTAREVFERMVAAQGGDLEVALPEAPVRSVVCASDSGVVRDIDALAIGRASWRLGAGRDRPDARVDPAAGVAMAVAVGDRVKRGDVVGVLCTSDRDLVAGAQGLVEQAIVIGEAL